MKTRHQNYRKFVQSAMERLRLCDSSLLIKFTSTDTDTHLVCMVSEYLQRSTSDLSSSSTVMVRGEVVICPPWSHPSTPPALTVINISNQSPCCLNTCEPCFRWTREMQNWALTQSSGTPESRPQRPKSPRGAQGQPNPETQKQMLQILSRLALKHDLEIRELQAATFHTMLVKHDEPLCRRAKRPRDSS